MRWITSGSPHGSEFPVATHLSSPVPRAALAVALTASGAFLASPSEANVYAYSNEAGDYVVSRERPKGDVEYAVLSDDGEFIRFVNPRRDNVPITHWRPFFLPKEPHPLDARPEMIEPPEPKVEIEEIEPAEPAEPEQGGTP